MIGRMVDVVFFDFGCHLECVVYSLGISSKSVLISVVLFKPFLFGIEHTAFVVQIFVGRQTDKAVVGFGILFVYKVGVVGGYDLDAMFFASSRIFPSIDIWSS